MGRPSKYTREVLEEAVAASTSIAGVLRHLGIAASGGMHAHISRRIKQMELDTSHFTGMAHRRGAVSRNRLPPGLILILRPVGSSRVKPHMLRRALTEAGVPYACACCGLDGMWQGKPLILHVDHINGSHLDSRLENLRFLCPNCHAQTPSWAGKNKNSRHYRPAPVIGSPVEVLSVPTLFEHATASRAS